MATVRAHIAHFSVGEYSKAGLARTDYEPAAFAAETQENIFSHVVGKGLCRPGTEYIGTTPSSNQVRLLPFVRAIDDVAVLELSDGKLRVIVDDEYVTRPSVTSTVTNGDFSSGTGWTITASDGAEGAIGSNVLTMSATARGSSVYCERSVTTSSGGTEHCLEIDVTRGPVVFQCGSTSGGTDYIPATTLDTGYHSLTFTPSGTYYVRFTTRRQRECVVNSIEVASSGIMEVTAPWTTAQLRKIRFDQSQDIMFLANANWQPRKIERRNNTTSRSVALYESNDGPFRGAVGNEVKLTPAATYGNTTLAADQDVFTSSMVGSLVRMYHEVTNQSWELAGDAVWTDSFIIRGVHDTGDRGWRWTLQSVSTGTWGLFSGTLTSQRSLTGPDGDFTDWKHGNGNKTETSSGTVTSTGNTADSQLVSYTRWGFKDNDYTSGVVKVTVDYEGYSAYGIGRITAYNSATSVDIEVLEGLTSTDGTRDWSIGAWGSAFQWPTAVAFFDGRLWFGGEDQFWASASDAYYTFDTLEDGDSATIQRSIATGASVARVNWFLPLQRLIIGTTGSEVSARSSSFDEPLTPTNITLKDASSIGSADVSPIKIDSRGIFVHRSTRSIHAVLYSFDNNDYTTDDLTETNEDICSEGIVELAVQREPETYVWCVRSDGQVAVLNYDWSESRQVKGWFRFVTDGEVESVAVVPDDEQDRVYMSVKRTIDGSTVRYVEKLAMHSEATGNASHKMADSHVTFSTSSTSVTAAHLANETDLVAWVTDGDGVSYPLTGLSADGSGVIALGGTYASGCVGLGYDCKYKSSRLAYGAQGGTALLQRKRVDQVGILMCNTHRDSVSFGPDFTTMRKTDLTRNGTAVGASTIYDVYDETPFAFPGQWDTDSRVCLKVSAPYPATFLGLVIGVETNEK